MAGEAVGKVPPIKGLIISKKIEKRGIRCPFDFNANTCDGHLTLRTAM
jgi:hypothetical protein